MNPERKNSTLVKIKKQPDNLEIVENALQATMKYLSVIKASCEDRTTEKFPVEDVREAIQKLELIRNSVDDLSVDEEYFRTVLQSKTPSQYFLSKLEILEKEKRKYTKKREAFNKFHKQLQRVYEEYFQ